jgi:hypothetical protein
MTEQVVDTTPNEEDSSLGNFFSEAVDGMKAMTFIDDTIVVDSFGKRAGIFALCGTVATLLYTKLAVKPALEEVSKEQRAKIIDKMVLGSVTIGKA